MTCCTCVGFDSGSDSMRMSIPLIALLKCGFMHHVVGFILEILLFVCGGFDACLGGEHSRLVVF